MGARLPTRVELQSRGHAIGFAATSSPEELSRRALLTAGLAFIAWPASAAAAGERLARAARAQVGVTRHYDSGYRKLAYPGGDPPRAIGVCADVIVRAYRDGLGLDLQKLVHEDMARDFAAYPSRRVWRLPAPDASIDHRRVLNLETFFERRGGRLWRAADYTPGFDFGGPLQPGDVLTWTLLARGAHIGMVVQGGASPRIVHNVGWGAQEIPLAFMWPHRARARFRWPRQADALRS